MNKSLSRKEYFVKDLVIDDEYGVIESTATIQEAANKMKELGVPDLVVIKEEKVLGVIYIWIKTGQIHSIIRIFPIHVIQSIINTLFTIYRSPLTGVQTHCTFEVLWNVSIIII